MYALDDWELTHPLTANAYKVMRKLLYLAAREGFPQRVSVPNSVLMSIVGCSEDSLFRASSYPAAEPGRDNHLFSRSFVFCEADSSCFALGVLI